MNRFLKLVGPLWLALVLGGAAWAQPAVPHAAKPPFPQLTLPDRASGGQRAIDSLGTRLPEVAAWYGKSADEFKAMLLKDRTLPSRCRPPRPLPPAPARWMAAWRHWSRPSCCTAARARSARSISISRAPR